MTRSLALALSLALAACGADPAALSNDAAEVAVDTVTEVADDTVTEVADDTVTEVADDTVTEVADDTVTEVADDTVTEVADDTVTEVADDTVTEVADDAAATLTCTPRTPGTGKAPGTNDLMPGGTRLRAATSSDGVHWTRLAASVADQSATPTMARASDGRPLLYYTAHKVDGVKDGAALAIGALDGRSWTHCDIVRVGFPGYVMGSDPDIVARPEGGYRLFLTGGVGEPVAGTPQPIGIHWADSDDGVTFTYGGVAFSKSGVNLLDSMTFVSGGIWHMYTLQGESIAMAHGTSTDGKTFTWVDTAEQRIGGEPHVLSHFAAVGDGHRVFGFGPRGAVIRAFDVGAGAALSGDATPLLAMADGDPGDLTFVKDPAVTRLADGSYLMVYATALP